jgi:predicted AAA+ superfamily ATPase
MISRILTLSGTSSYFLLGPRGVGKTKFLFSHFPNALYIDLLEDEKFNMLLSSTQRLEQLIDDSGKKQVVIDEVQKIPRILDEVHRLIENVSQWIHLRFFPTSKIEYQLNLHFLVTGRFCLASLKETSVRA